MAWRSCCLLAIALYFVFPPHSFAQEDLRPLASEEVGVLPQGIVDLKVGFAFAKSNANPFSSREGYTFRIPTLRLDIGLGGVGEVQFEGDAFIHFRESFSDPGDHEEIEGDLRIFTKIRLLDPGSRSLGLGAKIGVKLPNTSDESGLGSDETDFFALLLFARPWNRAHLHASAGLGILGDPTGPRSQNDVFIYSLAIDVPFAGKWKWMAEGRGLTGSGVSAVATLYTGFLREGKRVLYDCGAFAGLTDPSDDVGITCEISFRRPFFR